ncbi:MAG: DTW domain-containing protein [Bacteriovoracaceae bacterium]|nr:DTW domain-containing protein [Bacteriovoracaceae bacterium]
MSTKSEISYREHCFKCMRPQKACFCAEIKPFATEAEFCLLMHPMEAKLSHIGTGRLAKVALKNSRIIVGESFDDNLEVQKLIHSEEYFPVLLYPGKTAINISKDVLPMDYFQQKKPLFFILDGTWPCAKKMMKLSRTLHTLPRVSFETETVSQYHIRQQPAKFCLSTIESIYQVLSILEKQGREKVTPQKETLLFCLSKMVEFQIKCASDPNLQSYRGKIKPYSKVEDRKISKKWTKHKICYEG